MQYTVRTLRSSLVSHLPLSVPLEPRSTLHNHHYHHGYGGFEAVVTSGSVMAGYRRYGGYRAGAGAAATVDKGVG